MINDQPVKGNTSAFRVFEVKIHYFSVRSKGKGKTFTKRSLPAKILKYLVMRTSRYLGNTGLGREQLAAFHKGASSQIQQILNTVKTSNFDGYTYCMEVSMVVTPIESGDSFELVISRVFYRDFNRLVRDRGQLIKDQSWLIEASRRARSCLEGGSKNET